MSPQLFFVYIFYHSLNTADCISFYFLISTLSCQMPQNTRKIGENIIKNKIEQVFGEEVQGCKD